MWNNTLLKITRCTETGKSVSYMTAQHWIAAAIVTYGCTEIHKDLNLRMKIDRVRRCEVRWGGYKSVDFSIVRMAGYGDKFLALTGWMVIATFIFAACAWFSWQNTEAAHIAAADKAFWECKGNVQGLNRLRDEN